MTINYDKTEKIGESIVTHGTNNNRIYLMKLAKMDYPNIIATLDDMAMQNNYTKIFSKIPSSLKSGFTNSGYTVEATLPSFYNGVEDVIFMSKYFNEERSLIKNWNEIKQIIDISRGKSKLNKQIKLPEGYQFHICEINDSEQICEVYREVFETYPFPIYDQQYIEKTMIENFIYFSIKHKGKIVSLASTEMDYLSKSVEMTDFATLSPYRSNGFSLFLLRKMEEKMRQNNFLTAFTIARAMSHGMNITFSKSDYKYSGTLINNTNISGSLESMNVWYKILD